jgi:hypothetical protein
MGNAEKRLLTAGRSKSEREHFSGVKVFDNIANLRHLGKLPAGERLI